MQELVKEVTVITIGAMDLLIKLLPRRYTELQLTLSVLMHISPTIQYNAGHSYKINTHNTGAAWEYVFSQGGFLR